MHNRIPGLDFSKEKNLTLKLGLMYEMLIKLLTAQIKENLNLSLGKFFSLSRNPSPVIYIKHSTEFPSTQFHIITYRIFHLIMTGSVWIFKYTIFGSNADHIKIHVCSDERRKAYLAMLGKVWKVGQIKTFCIFMYLWVVTCACIFQNGDHSKCVKHDKKENMWVIPLLKKRLHVSSLIGKANSFTSQWNTMECL